MRLAGLQKGARLLWAAPNAPKRRKGEVRREPNRQAFPLGGSAEMAEEKELTVRQAGQKGGETTKRRHGSEFYASIGRKGGQQTKRRKHSLHCRSDSAPLGMDSITSERSEERRVGKECRL